MKNNYFSISKYVEENSFNYLHNEPYLLEDFSINEHDDSSDNLQQKESEENFDNFSEINKIMNPTPNSDFDEKEEEGEEEEEIYFLNKKEKNSSFLGHKRNNNPFYNKINYIKDIINYSYFFKRKFNVKKINN